MKPAKLLIVAILAVTAGTNVLAQGSGAFDPAPWRVSASIAGSPGAGTAVQAALSHDHLLGPLGVRLAAEYGLGTVPTSVTASVIEVVPAGAVDVHAGLGVGVSFETAGVLTYGELLFGASFRFSQYLGAFAEGRFRTYFDGTAEGMGGLTAGVQLRF